MDVIELAGELIARPSVSRDSNQQVSQYIAERLHDLDFTVEWIEYVDRNQITKVSVVGRYGPPGTPEKPGLAYFGHSDVVPAPQWRGPSPGPFVPAVVGNRLYGRGACDMKGSLAAMLVATRGLRDNRLTAPCFFVCTADEEIGYEGARQVVSRSQTFQELLHCQTPSIIGEPTQLKVVHAHKGICGLRIVSRRESAHSSSRLGLNANLAMIPFLQVMKELHDETESLPQWQNNEFEPPTLSWNIGINDSTHAINMKPAESVCTVLFRPVPGVDIQALVDRSAAAAAEFGLEFQVFRYSEAVYTPITNPFVQQAMALAKSEHPETVAYGTDASELRMLHHKILCGPGSISQAHTADEWIDLSQLQTGVELYRNFLKTFCLE